MADKIGALWRSPSLCNKLYKKGTRKRGERKKGCVALNIFRTKPYKKGSGVVSHCDVAACCSVLRVLQCVVHGRVLQVGFEWRAAASALATHYNTLQYTATHNTLHHAATHCNTRRCLHRCCAPGLFSGKESRTPELPPN
jgi:hypothetical protein